MDELSKLVHIDVVSRSETNIVYLTSIYCTVYSNSKFLIKKTGLSLGYRRELEIMIFALIRINTDY